MDRTGIVDPERLTQRSYVGSAIVEVIPQLANLRIAVFYDFPYLYEGSLAYEMEYLKIYANDPRSIVHVVFDGEKAVGATTGIPLAAETNAVKAPFLENGIPVETVFYFGESILLHNYRGLGLGHAFFDVREAHALQNGFSTTAFCSVVRPEDHALRPVDYRPNDAFWLKRGYEKQVFTCTMSWLDRDQTTETPKALQFWTKTWK